ncbi:MAG TPA: hypothetical protein VFD56_03375 [Chitinophagaceae bacterium]|nr:hypothetical protein [Chitinophagaceae bacterium]
MITVKKFIGSAWSRIVFALALSITGVLAFAQEKGLDVDINVNKENEWYKQTWVWVVGGAVFILLLVALLRSGSPKKG